MTTSTEQKLREEFEDEVFFSEDGDDSCKGICDWWLSKLSSILADKRSEIEKLGGWNEYNEVKEEDELVVWRDDVLNILQ